MEENLDSAKHVQKRSQFNYGGSHSRTPSSSTSSESSSICGSSSSSRSSDDNGLNGGMVGAGNKNDFKDASTNLNDLYSRSRKSSGIGGIPTKKLKKKKSKKKEKKEKKNKDDDYNKNKNDDQEEEEDKSIELLGNNFFESADTPQVSEESGGLKNPDQDFDDFMENQNYSDNCNKSDKDLEKASLGEETPIMKSGGGWPIPKSSGFNLQLNNKKIDLSPHPKKGAQNNFQSYMMKTAVRRNLTFSRNLALAKKASDPKLPRSHTTHPNFSKNYKISLPDINL